MSAVSSSLKRTANNPRRFDRIWKHCKNQARRLVSKIIKLCSASRMTFRAWFYRTDPQNIGGQFGTSQKKPEIYFRPKSFRTIFEKGTPVYSFVAPLLGLAKSILILITTHGGHIGRLKVHPWNYFCIFLFL